MKSRKQSVALPVIFSLLVACGGGASEAERLQKAKGYVDARNFDAATIELKNVLQENGDNLEARLLLGQVYLETGDVPGAATEFKRASELGVGDELVLPQLAQVLLMQGEWEDLRALSVENLSPPAKAEVLAAQGLGRLAQGETDVASSLVHEALALDASSQAAHIASARILTASGDVSQARKQLDLVFATAPDNPEAWSALGDLELRQAHLEEAEKAYTAAIEKREADFGDRLKRAQTRIQLQKFDEAQKDVDLLTRQAPRHPAVNFVQGVIHYHNKQDKDVVASMETPLQVEKSFPLALFYAGSSHLRLNNLAQAESLARRFHAAEPDNIAGRMLLAMVEMGNRKFAAAEELIRPVLRADPDNADALNLLANALMGQGKTAEAVEILSAVAAQQPESPAAQFRLASGLLASGDQAGGVDRMEAALELDPGLQDAEVVLVLNYLQQNETDKAIRAAEDYRDRNPDNAGAYNLLARVYLAADQQQKADAALQKARSLAPGDPFACQTLAALALKAKDLPAARKYFEEVLQHNKDYLPVMMKLAALDGQEKGEAAMVARLEQAINAHPSALEPRVVMARYQLAKGKPEQVAVVLSGIDETQKGLAPVLEVTASAQFMLKDFPRARDSLEKLVAAQPDAAAAHYLLAQTYAALSENDRMRASLQRTIELNPKHFPAHLALGRYYLLTGDRDAAKKELEVVKVLQPEHPDVLQFEASLAALGGKPQEAIALSERALEKSGTTSRMLVVARQKLDAGDRAGAQALQERWVAAHPEDVVARQELANFYVQLNQVDNAVVQFGKVLELDANNVMALNNLAWFLQDSDPKRALTYAKQAAGIQPEAANVLDTLAIVQSKNGDHNGAQRSIERALAKKPENQSLRFHSALIDHAAGDDTAALATLQALLKEDKEFPEKEEARSLLAKLGG